MKKRGEGLKLRFIDGETVEQNINMREAITAVRNGFKEKALGKTQMPPKSYIRFPNYNGDFRVMPAFLEDSEVAGLKVVNVHPDNRKLYGLPSIMAAIMLVNPRNGVIECIMDGTFLTALRTGAAGGVAAEHLARPDSKVVAMIGAGVQARTQLMALSEVMDELVEVRVVDKNRENARSYAVEMSEKLNLDVNTVDSIEKAVRGSDIVVTVTPVVEPIVKDEWIEEGVHINAIGADAPGKQELDPEILKRAKIVVDDRKQAIGSGEINVPISKGFISSEVVYAELGEIIAGLKPGRTSREEVTLFDSTGTAIQDVVTADIVFQKVREKGAGTTFEF